MITLRLDKNTEKLIDLIADTLKETKSTIIREAIQQYIEDKLDYLDAVKAMKKKQHTVPLEDVLEEFKNEQ